ncbi:MAG: hypothetical protein G01um101472_136 [Parcubacteria group bacterium Gr01-1014_72]|jgi:RsiW-degrading membrane proteinase PrsW (M82 family)|nr:MAG: hypothetical protein G01um101472_136 [Parcubacteria group bacterium Gr01-1014_72]
MAKFLTLSPEMIFFALLGGLLPALLWLFFWLREDRVHPEPRSLIMLSFLAGMGAVIVSLPLERFAEHRIASGALLFTVWAVIEEVTKLGGAYFAALRRKESDEPIDPMIYLITAALGFAALENTLFLLGSITRVGIVESIITGNLRFIGATLLHVLTSGSIGVFLGLSFYKARWRREINLGAGLLLAILLHTAFNVRIVESSGATILVTFSLVWAAIVLLLLFFERVKSVRPSGDNTGTRRAL